MIDLEQKFLRRFGWLFPVTGLLLGCLLDGGLWSAVTLDRSLLPVSWSGWITVKGLLFGVATGVIPLIWWWGTRIERKWGFWLRRLCIAPVGVLLLFLIAELGLRSPYGQTLLWQAVRVRAGESYFARELALFRLYDAEVRRSPPERAGLVIAGNSQMLHALDATALSERIERPVHRRAVAGMFPLELAASWGFLSFDPRNELLLMFSGFDLGARDRIYDDAVRPLATPEGAGLLFKAADPPFVLKYWRFFADLCLAACIEGWRSRDYLRWVLQHPLGFRSVDSSKGRREQEAQLAGYLALGSNRELVLYSRRLMELVFERAGKALRRVIVIEGQLNPAYSDKGAAELHALARSIAVDAERKGWIHYVPIDVQQPRLEPEDWLDMAHVNASGREKYTALFARSLAVAR